MPSVGPSQVFATSTDFTNLAGPPALVQSFTSAQITAALNSAASEMTGSLSSRWVMPLKQWGQDLVRFNVDIAIYLLLKQRGFNPNNPAEQSYIENYERIRKTMTDIANDRYTPDQIQDSSGAPPFANAPIAIPNTVSPTTGTPAQGRTWGTWARR